MNPQRQTPAGDGDCYAIAGRAAMSPLAHDPRLRIVHATVTGRGKVAGITFGHAWIELDHTVVDRSNGRDITMDRHAYYELGKVRGVRKYTASEARQHMLATEHFGPWE